MVYQQSECMYVSEKKKQILEISEKKNLENFAAHSFYAFVKNRKQKLNKICKFLNLA
jgi:hypothetical protein